MKKLIVAVAVVGLCISFAQVQAVSLSLRPMFGFGIGTGKISYVDYTDSAVDATGKQTKNENLYYSAGGGIKFGLGADAEIAEHIALGLDVGYSLGSSSEIEKHASPTASSTKEAKTSYLPISLTLKVKSKLEKMTVYAGMGPTLLMAPKGIQKYSSTSPSVTYADEAEVTFKMGLGYHGLAGIEYGISDKMSFIGQLRIDQVSIKADKMEYTKATLNGKDDLATWTVRQKNITFEEDDTADDDTKTNVPDIDNAFVLPANCFTLNIGISYSF